MLMRSRALSLSLLTLAGTTALSCGSSSDSPIEMDGSVSGDGGADGTSPMDTGSPDSEALGSDAVDLGTPDADASSDSSAAETVGKGDDAAVSGDGDGGVETSKPTHWLDIATTTLSARRRHTAVWTGSEMIVWGGYPVYLTDAFADGASYNVAKDAWAMLPAAPSRATPADGVAIVGEPAPARAEPKPQLLEVKSPMVGTFYHAPEPGAKPYVTAGARVGKGQIVCIIEAMKIMNEIESEFAGVIKEVVAQDAQPVEYGQVLFRIDPNG
ncbi:MAG: hypothetical protein NVSMB1_09210 [Polyangiales bacterium]